MFYDKNKIVMGLTVRGKYADRFWFSLFHEIGHIVLGHIGQRDGTSLKDEEDANVFARDILIDKSSFDLFAKHRDFTKSAIIDFSESIGIDPGIVVGRLQKEGLIDYSWHKDLMTKYEISV